MDKNLPYIQYIRKYRKQNNQVYPSKKMTKNMFLKLKVQLLPQRDNSHPDILYKLPQQQSENLRQLYNGYQLVDHIKVH